MSLSNYQQSLVLNLARSFVRHALAGTSLMLWGDQDLVLKEPAGCFVTLHTMRNHALRGCVGRIEATKPLVDALRSASQQVLRDPRFADNPVRSEELPLLEIEVSVLSAPHPVPTPLDFEPLQHGIYLNIGNRAGCFLPQVAQETGWTREQLLDRLCTEKLGLSPTAWRNSQARLSVFAVLVIGPEPYDPSTISPNWKT